MALTQISTAGVKNDAVTAGKIPADAIGSSEIAANAVGSSELADNAVDTAAIAADAVTAAKIADSAVTENKIHGGAVTQGKLANNSVTSNKIAVDAISNQHISNNSVNTAEIYDQAITLAKLEHGTSSNDGKFLRANNGADPTFETVTGTTINNNADNRVITGSGTANTLNGEANLTFSSSLNLTDSNGIASLGGNYLLLKRTTGTANYINAPLADANLILSADENLLFHTVHTADYNSTERMRIDSSGRLLLGTTTEGNSNGDELTISKDSGAMGMTLRSGDSSNSHIYFSDATSGAGEYAGYIAYQHSDNSMHIGTDSGERIHIKANGNVGINTSSPTDKLHVSGTTLLGGNTYITGNTYLSNSKGIYFDGGSTSANYLDDYEEGTFNAPYYQGGTFIANADGKYTKIGNRVMISVFEFAYNGASLNDKDILYISGLPFAAHSQPNSLGTIARYNGGNHQTIGVAEHCYIAQGGTQIKFDDTFNSGSGNWTVSLVYEAA